MFTDDIDFIFYFECRKLTSLIEDKKQLSLEELVHYYHCPDLLGNEELRRDLFDFITQHPDRIMIIIDGLDELAAWDDVFNLSDDERTTITGIRQQAEIPVLLYSLIYENLLHQSKVLVTTRPNENISSRFIPTVIVALGFDEEAIDECSFAVCDFNWQIHEHVTQFMLKHPQLYVHCVVPINCVLLSALLCSDHKKGREEDEAIDRLTRLTIRIILDIIHKRTVPNTENRFRLDEDQRRSFRSLAKLAADGLVADRSKIIFSGSDLAQYEIKTSKDQVVSGLLEVYKDTDIGNIDGDHTITASFLHLSIQEFLAAVHVCITWEEKMVRKMAKVEFRSRRADLEFVGHSKVATVKKKLDMRSKGLDNVQMYVAGLLGDVTFGNRFLEAVQEPIPKIPMEESELTSLDSKDHKVNLVPPFQFQAQLFLKVMHSHSTGGDQSELAKLQMICCAHEGRSEDMVKEVASAVLEESIKSTQDTMKSLDLREIPGGLLPHHLSSIGYFVNKSKSVGVT